MPPSSASSARPGDVFAVRVPTGTGHTQAMILSCAKAKRPLIISRAAPFAVETFLSTRKNPPPEFVVPSFVRILYPVSATRERLDFYAPDLVPAAQSRRKMVARSEPVHGRAPEHDRREVRGMTTANRIATYDTIVGATIKSLREAGGVSQTKLAGRLGIAQSHMSRMESGSMPLTMARLAKIAELLSTTETEVVHQIETLRRRMMIVRTKVVFGRRKPAMLTVRQINAIIFIEEKP